jgi:SAM-dependent methyltransferase
MNNKLTEYIKKNLPDIRSEEYQRAIKYLNECTYVLDVGCGTGTFMEVFKNKSIGIDINEGNIEECKRKNLNAQVGNALKLDFADETFDGLHCSHVLQVFNTSQAVQMFREFGRVVKVGGKVVISTLNDFKHFYQHPENCRPFPPSSIRSLFGRRGGSTSPMFDQLPDIRITNIWIRREPLIKFRSELNATAHKAGSVFNIIQYKLFIRKPFKFDAYIVELTKY